jgi:hypothetical protein
MVYAKGAPSAMMAAVPAVSKFTHFFMVEDSLAKRSMTGPGYS